VSITKLTLSLSFALQAIDEFGGIISTFTNPLNVGENGLWPVNSTQRITGTSGVRTMEVCMTGSGAITSLEYKYCPDTTFAPSSGPTAGPTTGPTAGPTTGPTSGPTGGPTPAAAIPSSTPTAKPTAVPTISQATSEPTAGPTNGPTEGPTAGPTGGPTPANATTPGPTMRPTTCNIIQCDFSTLAVGVPLTDIAQAAALRVDCLMSVSVTNTIDNNVGNIFDSTDIRSPAARDDPDLGAPNKDCPNSNGPGRGIGGKPDAPFPNCEPLGNLLIIQNENIDAEIPNDSPYGGCFVFTFLQPVTLLGFGIMDVDETETATISITSSTGTYPSFESPTTIGDNGHWKAATTYDLSALFADVVSMEICLPGSGAVSFVDVDPCG
jgi:hypothetical protein